MAHAAARCAARSDGRQRCPTSCPSALALALTLALALALGPAVHATSARRSLRRAGRSARRRAGVDGTCAPAGVPHLDEAALPAEVCQVFRRACIDQNTLITHDWRYSYSNPQREHVPSLPKLEHWNFPIELESNSDALKGRMGGYRMEMRPKSAREPTPWLRRPSFSNCTLPVVFILDFPFNMGEFLAKSVTAIDNLKLDDRVTVALVTPQGMGLAPYHSLMLLPYSRYPVVTAAQLGERGCSVVDGGEGDEVGRRSGGPEQACDEDGAECAPQLPVPWSGEPSQPHCFERFVVCKFTLHSGGGTPVSMVAARLVDELRRRRMLPQSPIAWADDAGAHDPPEEEGAGDPRGDTVLRVLLESRHGPVRNLKNMQELLDACAEMDKKGFEAGPFTSISCRPYEFAARGSGDVDRAHFTANLAAVRSAHVQVVVHGAGASNSWYMRQDSSALVELRPCRFGTHFASWPDKYMPNLHEHNGDKIKMFAYNVEDPAQCLMGDPEAVLRNHTVSKDNVEWQADYFARDQHLLLRPGPLLAFLAHVGRLLPSLEDFTAARQKDKLHGYAVPDGLMFGPLGISDVAEYIDKKHPKVLPV